MKKKLALSRETLRVLSASGMGTALGGSASIYTDPQTQQYACVLNSIPGGPGPTDSCTCPPKDSDACMQ